MKKQSNIQFTSISTEGLANLTQEVTETIAFGLAASRNKIFTTADLWNIRSHAKARTQRRYL
ncbi:MAG: hypothetical protein ABIQ31_23645 [Ferruginibacter sp.]